MIKNPKKHRRQKYENPPITTTEGLTHRGSSSNIYIYHDEFNYSPLGFSFLVCNLVSLPQLPCLQRNTILAVKKEIQQKNKASSWVQKCETTQKKEVKHPYTPTSLEQLINIGAL